MKVFNLRCEREHHFEGWFPSLEESERQLANHMTRCPVCDSADLTRVPSAPRLNISSGTPAQLATASPQSVWLRALRELIQNTEDVGPRFAEEARRIHYGEVAERAIRGVASERERIELHEEGIEVIAVPVPPIAKEPLQ
jgi:hypothetical protein